MADRKKNYDDETLRRHLEEQRVQSRRDDNKSPSLVSLVEGDNNAVFKPITFLSIMGTVIFAIVATVTQIINFNNTFGEMEKTISRNVEQVVEMRDELDELKNNIRSQLLNTTNESANSIDTVVNRIVELERKVDDELRFTGSRIDHNNSIIDAEVIDIKDELRAIRNRIGTQADGIRTLETQIRVLEIRYERLSENS